MELEPMRIWHVSEIALVEMRSKQYELSDLPTLYSVLSQIARYFSQLENMESPNIQLSQKSDFYIDVDSRACDIASRLNNPVHGNQSIWLGKVDI
jgi:hypothetical protein